MAIDEEEIAHILEADRNARPAPAPETSVPPGDDWTGPRPDPPREPAHAPGRGFRADLPVFLVGLLGILLLFSLAIWSSQGEGTSYPVVLAIVVAFSGLTVIFWGGILLVGWRLNRLTGGRLEKWMGLLPEPPGWLRFVVDILGILGR